MYWNKFVKQRIAQYTNIYVKTMNDNHMKSATKLDLSQANKGVKASDESELALNKDTKEDRHKFFNVRFNDANRRKSSTDGFDALTSQYSAPNLKQVVSQQLLV